MEYRRLGNSGLKVSTICLGAMTFGEADENSFMHQLGCNEETSFQLMNTALDAGVNFIDVADVYGQDGLSERVIGKWFSETGKRNQVVLATKFRFRMWPGPLGTGASRYHIKRAVDDSLRRLNTDHIDLYQIHMQDRDVPEDEILRALDDLVRQGKVLYIGASNYAAYRLMDSLWLSRSQNLERFVALQAQYSLVVRELEREHVPLCEHAGLGILPWSPLGGGFLSGKYRKDQPPPSDSRLAKWSERLSQFDKPRNWQILDALDKVAAEINTGTAEIALAWLLRKPAVTSVIIGARTLAQLEANLSATQITLTDEQMSRLDQASDFDLGYPYNFIKQVQGKW